MLKWNDCTQKITKSSQNHFLYFFLLRSSICSSTREVMVNASKLKITGTEVFFDELPDIICLGVYSKSLDLSHIL